MTLTWSAPTSNGGAAITRYEVSHNNGTWTSTGTSTNRIFTSLSSGTHTFRVRAVNSAGAGASSTSISSAPIVPPTLTATRGTLTSTSVTLTGNITGTGGAAITDRGFWIRPAGQTQHTQHLVTATTTQFSHTITGLLPGTTYHARAVARNRDVVTFGQSNELIFTTPATVPGAPRNLSAVPGATQVTLSWQAPASNGGAAIIRYEVALNSGGWTSVGNTTSHIFRDLTAGTHTFRVRAVNSAGAGPQANITNTPITAPTLTTTRGTITHNSVHMTGNITNTGGAAITQRGFWIRPAGQTEHQQILVAATTNQFSHTIPGLLPGTTYHVRAVARNSVITAFGQGNEQIFTTPAVVPSAPRNLSTISGIGQVTLNWTAPASNGGAAITRYEVSLNNSNTWTTAQSTTSHVFTGLAAGTHTLRVRAVNSAGAGAQASAVGTSNAPATVSVTLMGNGGLFDPNWSLRPLGAGLDESLILDESIQFDESTLFDEIIQHDEIILFDEIVQYDENMLYEESGHVYPADYTTLITTDPTDNHEFEGIAPATAWVTQLTIQVPVGTLVSQLPLPVREEHGFDGWRNPQGVVVASNTPITANSTFTAGWVRPTLRVEVGTTTHNSVRVTGIIEDTAGAIIIRRGFRIRRPGHAAQNHWPADATSNPFTHTIPNLLANTTYYVSAIIEIRGGNIVQSAERSFTTQTQHTVTFNPNGGTVSPTSRTVQSGTTVVLPTPVRDGFVFTGWFEHPTSGILSFNPTTPIRRNITLYARWAELATIRFNGNGGTVSIYPARIDVAVGQPIYPLRRMPSATRTGYVFAGWYTAPTGDGDSQIFDFSTVNNSKTLYARWVVTATFNHNINIPSTFASRRGGYAIGDIPTPRRTGVSLGHVIDGWFTAASGGTRVTSSWIVPNNNFTIFARWRLNTDPSRHKDYWWHSNVIPLGEFDIHYSLASTRNVWINAMTVGIDNWNESDAPVRFEKTSSDLNRVIVEPEDDLYLAGWILPQRVTGTSLDEFDLVLNSNAIRHQADAGRDTLAGVITTVMAHELGHVVGLRDDPPFDSLMSWAAIGRFYGPTQDDIESVEMIYDW